MRFLLSSRCDVVRQDVRETPPVMGSRAHCMYMCVFNKLLASVSGDKGGIYFVTGLSMLRPHILQRTHITITLNLLGVCLCLCVCVCSCVSRTWERAMARLYNIRDTTGSYFVSCEGHIFMCTCVFTCVYVVYVCVRRYVFIHFFLSV